ncbi:hypothetical protein YC2023_047234 [Brassica napus]
MQIIQSYFNDVAVSKPVLETVGEICLWRFALGRWNMTARHLNLFSITSEHLPANCRHCWIEVIGTLPSMFDRCCKPLDNAPSYSPMRKLTIYKRIQTETDSMNLVTPSDKRIVQRNPVKPSTKFKEMYW